MYLGPTRAYVSSSASATCATLSEWLAANGLHKTEDSTADKRLVSLVLFTLPKNTFWLITEKRFFLIEKFNLISERVRYEHFQVARLKESPNNFHILVDENDLISLEILAIDRLQYFRFSWKTRPSSVRTAASTACFPTP